MRLLRLSRTRDPETEQDAWIVYFQKDGVQVTLPLPVPGGWDAMTRQAKIDWGKAYINTHLVDHAYVAAVEDSYPDYAIQEDSKTDFDDLPGWGQWSADAAVVWIENNVTDLASAKVVLTHMAQAIVYLRNIVIER